MWGLYCTSGILRVISLYFRRHSSSTAKLHENSTTNSVAPPRPTIVCISSRARESTSPREKSSKTYTFACSLYSTRGAVLILDRRHRLLVFSSAEGGWLPGGRQIHLNYPRDGPTTTYEISIAPITFTGQKTIFEEEDLSLSRLGGRV